MARFREIGSRISPPRHARRMKLMWKKKRGGRKDKRGTEDSGIILFSASFSTTSSFSFSSTTHCHTVVHAVRQYGGGAEEGEAREYQLAARARGSNEARMG